MKILLLHNKIPVPLSHAGINKGITNYINVIKEQHNIDFLCPYYTNEDDEEINKFEKDFIKVIKVRVNSCFPSKYDTLKSKIKYYGNTYLKNIPGIVNLYRFKEIESKLKDLLANNDYDLIQVYSLYMCSYVESIQEYSKNIVLGPIDDEIEASRLIIEYKTGKQKLTAKVNYNINRNYFGKIYNQCRNVLFFSKKDIETTNKEFNLGDKAKLCLIPHELDEKMDYAASNPYPSDSRSILFVGSLSPFFNQDAVKYFVSEIFPKILKEIPDSLFYIVGQGAPQEIIDLGKRKNVIVTGKVSDDELKSYIIHADVYVSPLRTGTGLKTKIIEALKFGKAIVSTSHSLNALWGFNDDNIRITDDTTVFSKEIVTILNNENRKLQLGKNARILFENEYSNKALKPKLLEVINGLNKSNNGK
ncbi:MAG: glycosyltransferase family 4 protein [Ignavibacteria bacterium]|nr:glycosyltransferase family 4 protein [Ignavibacteria bacterium]